MKRLPIILLISIVFMLLPVGQTKIAWSTPLLKISSLTSQLSLTTPQPNSSVTSLPMPRPFWEKDESWEKKTREWLNILILPIVLGLVRWLYGFITEKEKKNREIALEKELKEKRSQSALKDYFDRVSKLLIDHNLTDKTHDSPEARVAQAITVSVFKELDSNRINQIIEFLKDLDLIQNSSTIALLRDSRIVEADLSSIFLLSYIHFESAVLKRTNFSHSNLSSSNFKLAKLHNTIFTETTLIDADFSNSQCIRTNFTRAKLQQAKFHSANMTEANLEGANLTSADLSNATITEDQLKSAILCRTILPSGISLDPNRDCY